MAIETSMAEVAIEQNLERFLLVLSVSLSVATLPQIVSWFRRIPYTLLLVIVGLGLAVADVRLINLSPSLILFIFLPPLLFEAAWNLKWSDLKRNLVPIILFAILGVVISTVGITLGLYQIAGEPIAIAALIGASLAATDPVSVTALFRELGVVKRLSVLMEGESLFNDGMAVVVFSFLVGLSLGESQLGIRPILVEFFVVVGLGLGMGLLIGFGISYLTQRFDLPLVEQSLTLVSAYGSYILTEQLGGSGVIGVVVTGLVLGNFGSRIGMNPRTRIIVTEFWEFIAFFVNSIMFLLIGDQILFRSLLDNLPMIAITIGLMIVTRAISIYGLTFFANRTVQSEIPLSNQTILWWGGLRGSVSIALALSVPATLEGRDELIAIVFGVVLFTLLVQGLTIQPLLKALNLLGDQPVRQEYSELVARRAAIERVLEHLTQMKERPEVETDFYNLQKALVKGELQKLESEINTLIGNHPNLRDFTTEQLRSELMAIEANTYAEFVRSGRLNEELAPSLQLVFNQHEEG
jgi:monovalent cation:H+ antiporter, CPA1 family